MKNKIEGILETFNENIVFVTLILLPFFEMAHISSLLNIQKIYLYGRVCSVFFICLFLYKNKYKPSILMKFILVFLIFVIVNSFFRRGLYTFILLIPGVVYKIFLFMFIECLLTLNAKLILKSLSLIFSLMIFVNFIMCLELPSGLYVEPNKGPVFLLGISNSMTQPVLFGLACVSLYVNEVKGNRIYLLLVMLISFWTFIIQKSATGLFLVTIFILLNICLEIPYLKKLLLKINYYYLILAFLIFEVMLISGSFNFLSVLIEGVLKKDMTLSSRTYIWNECMTLIGSNFLLGEGKSISNVFVFIGGIGYSAHNFILQTMLESGLIGTGIFLSILIVPFRKNYRNIYEAQLIRPTLAFWVLLLNMLTETTDVIYIFIILISIYNLALSRTMTVKDTEDVLSK